MRRAALALAACGVLAGCLPVYRLIPEGAPPAFILGTFEDDYGIAYTVARSSWVQHPNARYDVVRWNAGGQYLIARNRDDNPSDGGRWTRIDWMPLEGMAPYTWAFCLTTYDAPTAAAAEDVPPADRAAPRTGCGGYPFSRMRPTDGTPPAVRSPYGD